MNTSVRAVTAKLVLITCLLAALPATAQRTMWARDPLITAQGCENLEYRQIGEFLERYYYRSLAYEKAEKETSRQMLENYAVASALIGRSQGCLAEALDLKGLVDKLREQQVILSSGTSLSSRQMKKQRRLTAEANAEIEAAARQIDELTPQQRDRFSKGVAAYMSGTYATARLFQSIDGYLIETKDNMASETKKKKSRFGGIPGLGKIEETTRGVTGMFGQAKGTMLVFGGLKDHTGELYKTSRFLGEYSRKNSIEVPQEASNSVDALGEWL